MFLVIMPHLTARELALRGRRTVCKGSGSRAIGGVLAHADSGCVGGREEGGREDEDSKEDREAVVEYEHGVFVNVGRTCLK